mmetsp:Transcript_110441/g.330350  ORF Transcript_110441/g.330350 Transcript_110441/m.330350 type:complete len:254 (+) Transcript_110441:345-1106(+)
MKLQQVALDHDLALLLNAPLQDLEELLDDLAGHARPHVEGRQLRQVEARLPDEPVPHLEVLLIQAMHGELGDVLEELLVPELHLDEPPEHDDQALQAERLGVDQAAVAGDRGRAVLRVDEGPRDVRVEEGDRPEHEVLHAVLVVGPRPAKGKEQVLHGPRREAVVSLPEASAAEHFLRDDLEGPGVVDARRREDEGQLPQAVAVELGDGLGNVARGLHGDHLGDVAGLLHRVEHVDDADGVHLRNPLQEDAVV